MNLRTLQLSLALMVLPMAVLVSAASAADLEQEGEAVRAADLELAKMIATRDVGGFKSLIAADGFFMTRPQPAQGPDQVAATWAAPYLDPESGHTLEWAPKEVTVAGSADLAYTIGDFVYRLQVPDGEPRSATGSYLTVWRKNEEGRWQVAADGSLVARDPVPPGFSLERLNRLAGGWAPLAAPDAGVVHERQPVQVGTAQSGDLAYTFGNYTLRATGADGKTRTASGAYFTVWTRAGEGPWKAVAESLMPPRPEDQP